MRDDDFAGDPRSTGGAGGDWSFASTGTACPVGDFRSLYEGERARADREEARADAAEARCGELRRSDTARSRSREARRLSKALATVEAQKNTIRSLRHKNSELRKAVKETEYRKGAVRAQSKTIERLRERLRDFQDQRDTVRVLSWQVDLLRLDLGGMQRSLERSEDEKQSLSAALADARADHRKALRRSRRQKTTIKSLSRKNVRLRRNAKTLRNRIEALEADIARLRSKGAVLSKRLYGRKSEQQQKPRSDHKRGQQRGAPGHGRTQRPGLEERRNDLTPPPEACVCRPPAGGR